MGGSGRSLVLLATADFDAWCAIRQEARDREVLVAATLNQRLIEQERRF